LYGNGLLSHSHASFSLPISKEIYQFKTQGKYTPEKKSIDFDSDMIESNWSKWYHNTLDLFDNDMLRSQIVNGNDIKNFLPLILDSNSFTQIMAWNDHNHLLKYYNDSYFSVVTETSFFRNISEKSLNYHLYKQSLTPISITEKIYKAIAHKHPFIYVSIDGALELLKSFGYKTYDTIIDESYSREPDPYKRMLKIIDEIKRLSNLNSEQLIEFKTRCKEIAEYNFNVFINKQNYIIRVT
jgi:hypothetical protein